MNEIFTYAIILDDILWQYIALFMIIFTGIYFTFKSKCIQFTVLFNPKKYIKELLLCAEKGKDGVHPLKLYFSSVGGMVGLGNLVTVVTAIIMGGPGAIVWMWIGSFLGMVVKYSEVYLGIKYRVKNTYGSYDGGPMYFLQVAFKNSKFKLDKILPIVICIFLCIYGAEVSQFLILTDTFTDIFNLNRELVIGLLLVVVMISTLAGVARLSNICSALMPPFMISYLILGIWIIIDNYSLLPQMFIDIFKSAFSFQSSVSGIVGYQILRAAHYGISRAVYSGDIGIGYDAIVQSETQTKYPQKQARLAIFGLFSDTLICTITVIIVCVTGVFDMDGIKTSEYIMYAIAKYIPFADYYLTCIFFIAAFTTIIGYLVVGFKAAYFIHHKIGKIVYFIYAVIAFVVFSFHDQTEVMLIMSVTSGILLTINLIGVLMLRNQIDFSK